jgi:glutamate decarboxylase
MPLQRTVTSRRLDEVISFRTQLAEPGEAPEVPRFRMADTGLSADTAYQVVHDELMLDGNARLNLATFVTTWMDPQAKHLMAECSDKNMIDKDEYPVTAELEMRCVNILADLWHVDSQEEATGCSTIGSSEACMLGGMALKWRWRDRRRAAGRPTDRPNLVMGANVQVCWEKFCRYWEVEPRIVPLEVGQTHLTPLGATTACDENTIGVVAVLGSTFDGSYEPVAEIADGLDQLQADTGLDVPIHVDAASGGFIAPFLDPDLKWDFRLPRVQSINVSGHKYGLVYPGVGWVVWRDEAALPEELVFKVDYLGGSMPTFGLNFSRPGAQIVAQYYNLIRLGREGYERVQQACRDTAGWLASNIGALGPYELVSAEAGIPAFAFRIRPDVSGYTVFDVSAELRGRGWLVPAYHMPPNRQDEAVLRIVVRGDLNRNLAQNLALDLSRVTQVLQTRGAVAGPEPPAAFHH